MPVHIHKKGIRALGISESFIKGLSETSVLAGVVMRADMVVDGFTFSRAKVGGMDSTQKVFDMYKALKRKDINILLLNGCVISWYNVIDLHYIAENTQVPLICVTYEESKGLEKYFIELFPEDCHTRIEIYHRNGPRTSMMLQTGHITYVRFLNMSDDEALKVLNKFTVLGGISEPLRIARLLARSLMRTIL